MPKKKDVKVMEIKDLFDENRIGKFRLSDGEQVFDDIPKKCQIQQQEQPKPDNQLKLTL